MRIKTNDLVLVIKGKDRGKSGNVMRVLSDKNRITIEGINKIKKHVKGQGNVKSEIMQFEAPISASNVMLICPNCQKKTRILYRKNKENRKERVCKKCNESVDQAREIKKVRK